MSKTALNDLFKKYLEDKLSPEEFDRLYELVNTKYDARALDALLESAFANPAFTARSKDFDTNEIFTLLQSKIQERENKGPLPAPVLPLPRRRRIAWSAAAAALLLAGVSWWYTFKHHTPVSLAENKVNLEAPPGHTGAILILADGRQLTLDSAKNGTVENQGGTRLLKRDGELSYTPGNPAQQTVLYNTMTTARGRQYQLVLSDGTRVWLNAASSIRFPTAFAGKERMVEVSGEAYFEVARNISMPFVVRVNKSMITVLGTSFDVMGYNDENSINTTLLTGAVSVAAGSQKIILKPGQQARIERSTGELKSRQVDTDPIVAWTKGQLSLGDSDLAGLMRQISRWYDVQVEFQGVVPDLHVGGVVDRSLYLSSVLEFLGRNGLHYKTEGKKIIILP